MKNYYYFLGISEKASEEDIRKAYRKLSLKYHPDKNNNDPFFAERFREVQEAYETLIDKDLRKIYDAVTLQVNKETRSQLPPEIKSFTLNKTSAKKGEEIVAKWNTKNADVVKILPFGLENAFGERVFKITEFKAGKFHVVIQATNTLLNKSVVQGITVSEIYESEDFINPHTKSRRTLGTQPKFSNPSSNFPIIIKILFIIFIVFTMLYLIFNS